jgi:hypothetical protein
VGGKPFAHVFNRLFQPGGEAPPAPQLLPGMTPEQTAQLQKLLESTRTQMSAMFDAALRADPDGWVRIPRTEVAQAVYEPLLAPGGHPIGIRLQFSVRFSAAGSYAVRPHVFPLYANTDWRGAVSMKVLDGQVAPAPKNTAADSLADVIRYGGAAQYQGDVEYRFLFEVVPRYVIRNKAGTRLCLFMEEFRAANRLPLWNEIAADSTTVRYRVDLSSLGFNADTEPLMPQRTFYESLLSEGAPDCGPTPNENF